jgi:hypothetical protein
MLGRNLARIAAGWLTTVVLIGLCLQIFPKDWMNLVGPNLLAIMIVLGAVFARALHCVSRS